MVSGPPLGSPSLVRGSSFSGTSSSVVTVSSAGPGGPLTMMVTTAVSVASLTEFDSVYEKVTVPAKPSAGTSSKVPSSLKVSAPWLAGGIVAGTIATVGIEAGGSLSLASTPAA